jgi:hypothetical protein
MRHQTDLALTQRNIAVNYENSLGSASLSANVEPRQISARTLARHPDHRPNTRTFPSQSATPRATYLSTGGSSSLSSRGSARPAAPRALLENRLVINRPMPVRLPGSLQHTAVARGSSTAPLPRTAAGSALQSRGEARLLEARATVFARGRMLRDLSLELSRGRTRFAHLEARPGLPGVSIFCRRLVHEFALFPSTFNFIFIFPLSSCRPYRQHRRIHFPTRPSFLQHLLIR